MEDWQQKHITKHRFKLIELTSCSAGLLAILKSSILSEEDAQRILSNPTSTDKADALYNIVSTKVGGYEKLSEALKETKQTGALKILMEGKEKQQKLGSLDSEEREKLVQMLKTQRPPPEDPKYYIKRMLSRKTKIDRAVFHDLCTKDNIFVISGITKYELSKIAKNESTDESGNQLTALTVRFILLNCEEDFDEILKIAEKPVHLFKCEANTFIWLKSSQMVNGMSFFVTDDADFYKEEDFFDQMLSPNYPPQNSFIISDSPGMGKTFLASLLARWVQLLDNTIVLFYVFYEFVQNWPSVDSPESALQAIASHALKTTSLSTRMDLMEIFSSHSFHLFLDGYDEIPPEKVGYVNAFLYHVNKLPNFTVVVTTRPHLEQNICSAFQTLPYEILPFRMSDQIDFLTKYWINQYQIAGGENLTKFAENCLTALKEKMKDKENEVAGIPLQCWMLAEVYAKDAKRCSKLGFESKSGFKIHGIFDMYKELVTLKLKRLTKIYQQTQKDEAIKDFMKSYKHFHYYESIKLLFPAWMEKFDKHLKRRRDVDEKLIHAIGLLEKRGEKGKSRFIHRTFAEYLLADFLVRHLTKSCDSMDLIFEVILASTIIPTKESFNSILSNCQTEENISPNIYEVAHPNIAYFIDHHLKSYLKNHYIDHRLIQLHFGSKRLNGEALQKICMIPAACCCNNLENCFDLITKVLFGIKEINSVSTNHFNHLPQLVIMQTGSKCFVKKVMDLKCHKIIKENPHFDHFNPVPVAEKEQENVVYYNQKWLHYCTPLHLAVHQGNFEITKFLLEAYRDQINEMKYIMHVCVDNTVRNNENVISEKVEIIKLLHEHNKNWLEETTQDSPCPPLLQPHVHIKLLQTLVELGANINAYSDICGTLLHQSEGIEVLRWAISAGFTSINQSLKLEHDMQYPPLIHAIKYYHEPINEELLDEFLAAGADINAQDGQGNSVLFHAVQNASREVVDKILKHGANVNHKNKNGENAMHITVDRNYRDEEGNSHLVKFCRLLIAHGFNGINEITRFCDTPILKIMQQSLYKPVDEDLLEYFYEIGVNFNVCDNEGRSILSYALMNDNSSELFAKIVKFGADVNNKDNKVWDGLTEVFNNCLRTNCISTDIKREEKIRMLKKFTTILSNGFNQVNDRDTHGLSLLFKTVQFKYITPELVDLFHTNDADFTVSDAYGNSVLFKAIESGHGQDIISRIIKYGGNHAHRNGSGMTAVHIAVKFANFLALEYLLPLINVNVLDCKGDTPLHLLFANMDLAVKEKLGQKENRLQILELLLKRGANPKAKNIKGEMPLTKWISSLEMWDKRPQSFLEFTKFFKVDESIATNSLTALIMNDLYRLSIWFAAFKYNPFTELFNLLVDNGGKILVKENKPFHWKLLSKGNIWIQLADIQLTHKFLQELRQTTAMNIPMNAPHLWYLICSCNNVPIEQILSGLLTWRRFDSFSKLCEILRIIGIPSS